MSLIQLTRPITIDQLLANLRKNILVNAYEKFLHDRARRGEGNAGQEVHVAQSFFRVARNMGLGIPEEFISEQVVLGNVPDTKINGFISEAFNREYTPARIAEALFESVFAELGYYGVNHDKEGYASTTYAAFFEFFANALGIKITTENTDTLYANFMVWQKTEKTVGEDEDEDDEDSKIPRDINKKYVISETIKHLFKIGFFIKDPLTTTIVLSGSEAPAGGGASADSAAPTDTLELSFNPEDPMTLLFKQNKGDQTDFFFLEHAKHFKSDLNTIQSLEKNILSSTLSRSQKNDLIPLLYLQGINISATEAWGCLLRKNPDGNLRLQKLFAYYKDLANHITAEMLSAKFTAKAGYYENSSALFELAKSTAGRAVLKLLLDSNKALAINITAEMLSSMLTTQAGPLENTSALYWLARNPSGRAVLKKLLDSNKALAINITAEMLSAKLTAKAGEHENISALYLLAETTDGIEVLKKLLDTNAGLANQFNANMLSAKSTENGGLSISPFYLLAQCLTGRTVLKHLLKSNEDLKKHFTAKMLTPLLGVNLCKKLFGSPRPKQVLEVNQLVVYLSRL